MKQVLIIGLVSFVFACSSQKETVQEVKAIENEIETTEETVEETTENYRIIGIVHVSETDCPVYIEAREKEGMVNMYPVNMDAKFMREGAKIKFAYTKSRALQPANCNVDMVVSIEDVSLMR